MKISYTIILFFIFLTSCTYEPYSKEKYKIAENYRNLFNAYSIGDTLIFKSSQNKIDSFVITGIDSGIIDRTNYFVNTGYGKSISVTYKQIPVDRWQQRWLEGGKGGDNKLIEHSDDGIFITISKHPENDETEYYFNFKEFRCKKNDLPKLNIDTVKVDGQKITNYYKIENCGSKSKDTNAIRVCFSTIDKGLVAFITNNNINWTRQN